MAIIRFLAERMQLHYNVRLLSFCLFSLSSVVCLLCVCCDTMTEDRTTRFLNKSSVNSYTTSLTAKFEVGFLNQGSQIIG